MNLLDLYKFAEKQNYDVVYFPMRDTVSISVPEGVIGIDVDRIEDSQEESVALAHELGHCETGSFYNLGSPHIVRLQNERRAWKWANEHRIPREDFFEAIRAGMTEVWELAEYFDVPGEFMARTMEYYHELEGA